MPEYQYALRPTTTTWAISIRTQASSRKRKRPTRKPSPFGNPWRISIPRCPNIKDRLARNHKGLGNLYQDTGRTKEAEAAYKEALTTWKALVEKHPDVHKYQSELRTSYFTLGNRSVETGRTKEAEAAYKEGITVARILVKKHPEAAEEQIELAARLSRPGRVYRNSGRLKEAEAAYEEGIAIDKAALIKDLNRPEFQHDLANSQTDLGNVYANLGRFKEAEVAYNDVLAIMKTLLEKYPQATEYEYLLGAGYGNLGNLYEHARHLKDAEAAYGKAIAIHKVVVQKDPNRPGYQNALACGQNNLAAVYEETGRLKEAEAAYNEALAIRRMLVEKHPEEPEYQNQLVFGYCLLGNLYKDTGRAKEAETAVKEALANAKPLVEKHPEAPEYQCMLAGSHNDLCELYDDTGRAKEAEPAAKEALRICKILVEKHPDIPDYQCQLACSQMSLGIVYKDSGRLKEAEAASSTALDIMRMLVEKQPEDAEYPRTMATAYYNLARIHALALAETNGHAGKAANQLATSSSPLMGNAFEYLQLACDHGYFDKLKSLERMKRERDLDVLRDRPEYKKLLEKIAARPKPDSKLGVSDPYDFLFTPSRAEALVDRGSTFFDQGERAKAEADFEEALRIDPSCAKTFFERGEALAKANQFPGALAEYRKAFRLDPQPQFREAYLRRMNPADKRDLEQILADFRQPFRVKAKIEPVWLHCVSCWLPYVSRGAEKPPGFVWVSDMPWVRSTCGYRCPEATRDGHLGGVGLCIAGFFNVKGVMNHAFADPTPADVVLDISGRKFAVLKASATLLDHGSVQFQVLIDGKVKHKTQVMHYGDVDPISLDVTAAKEIVLRVLNDGGNGNGNDSAAWGFARFIPAGAEDPLEDPPAMLKSPIDANAALFLAEVHRRLDHKELARRWFDKAAEWMDKNKTEAEKLRQYYTEAGKLLGIPEKPDAGKAK